MVIGTVTEIIVISCCGHALARRLSTVHTSKGQIQLRAR